VLNAQGYLWNFDWGYKAGIHSEWAIIGAENARLVVPPLVRNRARITKLNKLTRHALKIMRSSGGGRYVWRQVD
jgi:hypothetical protein